MLENAVKDTHTESLPRWLTVWSWRHDVKQWSPTGGLWTTGGP